MSGNDVRSDAARWFSLHRSGDMTGTQAEVFEAWLRDSPTARAAYERIKRNWALLGDLEGDPEISAARERDARHFDYSRRIRWSLAAAAAVLLVISSSMMTNAPGISGALPQAGNDTGAQTFRTGPSQRKNATLADGSIVTLDANTELRVVEMRTRRRIELIAGHAFFRVAKDITRPFLVTAIDKTVHAIGTAFDVRITGATVTVTLVEGRVRVDQPTGFLRAPHSADLVPGRQLVAASDRGWTLTPVNPAQEMSWLQERLTFVRDPLAQAMAEVNSTSSKKIIFVGGAVPTTLIIGVFLPGDVDSFAKAMEMNGIAHIVSETQYRIEMAAN